MKYSFCVTSVGVVDSLQELNDFLPYVFTVREAVEKGEIKKTSPDGKVTVKVSIGTFKESQSSIAST